MKKIVLTFAVMIGVASVSQAQTVIPPDVQKLLQKHTCLACHNPDRKVVGPSYKEVMAKKRYKPEQIVELIYQPKPSNWPGYPAMTAFPQIPKKEAAVIAKWIASLN